MKKFFQSLDFEKKFIFLIFIYFILHTIVRTFISGSLEFDEAEQVLFSQFLSLGYGPQPPLYVWLQKIFFTVFGLSVFSLSLFKNILFVIIYVFLFKSSRLLLKNDKLAGLAALLLLLTHTYGWQSMRQLTHATLALAICSISFFIFLRLLNTRSTKYYVWLGVFTGLGIISKYNYLIFILALLLAGLSQKSSRKALLDKRILWIVFLPLVISAPHFFWVITNSEKITTRLNQIQAYRGQVKGVLLFLAQLLAIAGPFLVIFLIFFPKTFLKSKPADESLRLFKQLLERFFIFSLILLVIWVVLFKIEKFEERWLQLTFFVFPLYLLLRTQSRGISERRIKACFWVIAICAFIQLLMLVACAWFPGTFGYKSLHYPISELAPQIRQEGFDRGFVLSCDTEVAADIKLEFKDSLVLTHRTYFVAPKTYDKILLIWGDTWWYNVPRELAEILPRYQIQAERTEIVKQALYKHSKDKYYKVYLMVINR